MFRQRSRGSTGAIEAGGLTSDPGAAAGAAAAASRSAEDQAKTKAAKPRRGSLPALSWAMTWRPGKGSSSGGGGGKSNSRRRASWATSSSGEASNSLRSSDHGMTDFRLIPTWSFLTQHVREPEERMKTSIGTLYVKVVEGRGLMSSDLNGLSDPYVKLCLTGRYLSHGQEWSEKLRVRQTTKIVKYSLDPVWDEEFSLPVRRSGAVLKVEVWDWDRSSSDDPLGHFEVTIGEELLSQQPMDMWYVLEPPRGAAASAQTAAEKKLSKHQQAGHAREGGGDEEGTHVSGDEDEGPDSPIGLDDTSHESEFPPSPTPRQSSSNWKLGGARKSARMGLPDHSHESEQHERKCKPCIERRRKHFGEVRLLLWYQFDELAEVCSHTWPEEPLQPDKKIVFSPNQLYRKGTILWEMARPYVNFMKEADAIVSWQLPWRSLMWMIALVGMLVVPPILIVVVNAALMRIVVSAYLKHRDDGGGVGGDGDTLDSAATAAAAAAAAAATAASAHGDGPSPPSSLEAPDESGKRSSSSRSQGLEFTPASFASSWRSPAPAPLGHSGSGGETSGDFPNGREADVDVSSASGTQQSQPTKGSKRLLSVSLPGGQHRGGGMARRASSDPADSAAATAVGYSTGGGGIRNSASAPSRTPPWGANVASASPPSTLTLPPPGPATSFLAFSGTPAPATAAPAPAVSPTTSSSSVVNVRRGGSGASPKNVVLAAGAAAKGGVLSVAGVGGKNIKKLLLPARFSGDPELLELYARLGSTKRVPMVVNEVGKRLLARNGPTLQRGLHKMGTTLIQVRQRFHPMNARQLVPRMAALVFHMLLQLWLYATGRFNLYFALGVVGQFMNKLYKRWGRAFVMAVKEARRSYRTRQALSHMMSAATAAATSVAASREGESSPSSAIEAAKIVSNPFKFDAANPPAFAPPGTTPAVRPCPFAGETSAQHSLASSFFTRSPRRGSRRGSAVTSNSSSGRSSTGGGGGSRSIASTTGGGGRASSSHSSGGGGASVSEPSTPRGRRGTLPPPRTTPTLTSTPRSRSIALENTGSADPQASAAGTNGVSHLGGVNVGGSTSQATHGAGGKRPRRWSTPWGKKAGLGGSGIGDSSSNGSSAAPSLSSPLAGGMSFGVTSSSSSSSPSAGPRDLMTLDEEDDDQEEGQRRDALGPSPERSLYRLRPRGGGQRMPGKRANRRRVRWGRLLSASLALVCLLTALVVAFVFPESGVPSRLLLARRGVSKFQLFLFGQGEGGGTAVNALFGRSLEENQNNQDGN